MEVGSRTVAFTLDKRWALGAGIVTDRAFDLDHRCPKISQNLSRPWPCKNARQFKNLQTGKRLYPNA